MTNEIDRMCELSYARKEGIKEGEAKGEAKGEARGEARGVKKEKERMIKALREAGVSEDIISKAAAV